MSTIFKKLNLKNQTEILVLDAPESFEPELAALENVIIHRNTQGIKEILFSLAFVTRQKDVDAIAKTIARKAKADAVVWFAYPKGTSKKYKCDFNRDSGWEALGEAGFESVRLVAIDEDWSAKRFRRVDFIKTMMRDKSWAMTQQGKKKAQKTEECAKSDTQASDQRSKETRLCTYPTTLVIQMRDSLVRRAILASWISPGKTSTTTVATTSAPSAVMQAQTHCPPCKTGISTAVKTVRPSNSSLISSLVGIWACRNT